MLGSLHLYIDGSAMKWGSGMAAIAAACVVIAQHTDGTFALVQVASAPLLAVSPRQMSELHQNASVTPQRLCTAPRHGNTSISHLATSPFAEVMGLLLGLAVRDALAPVLPCEQCCFHTDSLLVRDAIQGTSAPSSHADAIAIARLRWRKAERSTRCTIAHCRAHSGHPWNELADQAAKDAVPMEAFVAPLIQHIATRGHEAWWHER
eukprot:6591069-Alexandrium_andersonii.AAC.1